MEKSLQLMFGVIYQDYLAWFRERARTGVDPIDEEQLINYQICHEDTFESADHILNRVYFAIPLPPTQSCSGNLEFFSCSTLNFMKKGQAPDTDVADEVIEVYPVEYRREQILA